MYGAIIGDMAGSIYEFHSWHGSWEDIPLHNGQGRFTDDTVMSVAVANALREADGNEKLFSNKLIDNFHQFGHMYPLAGYGGRFAHWLISGQREPYNSFGNGSAMRVSPVGWSFDSLEDTEKFAALSAAVTHNHPEGIKGAQAVAGAIFIARTGADKKTIKDYVTYQYGYDLDRSLNEIQKSYKYEISCQKSVPEAIIAFLEGDNYEDAIKKAIWLGGDADTQAAIAGSIAEAFYDEIPDYLLDRLDGLDAFLLSKVDEWRAWLRRK